MRGALPTQRLAELPGRTSPQGGPLAASTGPPRLQVDGPIRRLVGPAEIWGNLHGEHAGGMKKQWPVGHRPAPGRGRGVDAVLRGPSLLPLEGSLEGRYFRLPSGPAA